MDGSVQSLSCKKCDEPMELWQKLLSPLHGIEVLFYRCSGCRQVSTYAMVGGAIMPWP
jgi:hypothetical protein